MKIIAAVAGTMLLAGMAWAQESRGTIGGRAVDPSGAVVPGVEIKVIHTATNTTSVAKSNDQGNYLVPYLAPGMYRITAQASGFKSFVRDGIEVRTNDRLQVDITLEVGLTNESVTVTAETPLLDAPAPA
jgi:hypothetical protein